MMRSSSPLNPPYVRSRTSKLYLSSSSIIPCHCLVVSYATCYPQPGVCGCVFRLECCFPLPSAKAVEAAGVSSTLDLSFSGFGIEPSNQFSFIDGTNTNQLSVSLLQNLAGYSGVSLHIRLGGNTENYDI